MDCICGLAVRVVACALAMLSAFKTAFLARSYKAIWLFQTSVAIGPATTLGMLTRANYSGFAPVTVSALNGPALDAALNAYVTTNSAFFTHNGGPVSNQIFTAGLVGTIAGSTAATGTATESGGLLDTVTITLPGGVYQMAPLVTVNDPTGVGAVVTATIDINGQVDSLTIDDPGTGYTLPTLAIDPPVELLAGVNLDSPIPMTKATDALPIVIQVNVPTGV